MDQTFNPVNPQNRVSNQQIGSLIIKDINSSHQNPYHSRNTLGYTRIEGKTPDDPEELIAENENLSLIIKKVKQQRQKQNTEHEQKVEYFEEPLINPNIDFLIEKNNKKIQELRAVQKNKELIIEQYKRQFSQLEKNINNIQLLDQDIFKRLNAPNHIQLYAKVNQAKTALSTGIPNDVVLRILEEIG